MLSVLKLVLQQLSKNLTEVPSMACFDLGFLSKVRHRSIARPN